MTHRAISVLAGLLAVSFASAANALDDPNAQPAPASAAAAAVVVDAPRAAAPAATPAAAAPRTQSPALAHHSMDLVGPSYRSAGLAVALSLTPLPVDFGNLYVENIVWGAAYTTAEVALMVPMMWLAGDHMHGDGGDRNRSWSTAERGWEIGLVSAYVLVKVAAGVHAGYAAASFNRAHERAQVFQMRPSAAIIRGGAVAGAAGWF